MSCEQVAGTGAAANRLQVRAKVFQSTQFKEANTAFSLQVSRPRTAGRAVAAKDFPELSQFGCILATARLVGWSC